MHFYPAPIKLEKYFLNPCAPFSGSCRSQVISCGHFSVVYLLTQIQSPCLLHLKTCSNLIFCFCQKSKIITTQQVIASEFWNFWLAVADGFGSFKKKKSMYCKEKLRRFFLPSFLQSFCQVQDYKHWQYICYVQHSKYFLSYNLLKVPLHWTMPSLQFWNTWGCLT